MGGDTEGLRRRALRLGALCLGGLATVYIAAVWTAPGQRFEDAVLRAADRVTGSAEQARAVAILDAISVPSVVVAMVAVIITGLFRRRLFLGAVAAGMFAAAMTTTVLFQHFLERPTLLAHGDRRQDQSFPSGHAAVALALMCAVVLVVPSRLRGPALVLGSLWAASVGVATVTASWHRPSDTLGAGLIVVGWACGAVTVLARSGRVRPGASTGLIPPVGLAYAYAMVAVLALALTAAVVALVLTHHASDSEMLLAGRSLALSGSAAVAVAMLALLRHVDLGEPPVAAAEERSPRV
jgi:membrane-associated phospholipid phosphatase